MGPGTWALATVNAVLLVDEEGPGFAVFPPPDLTNCTLKLTKYLQLLFIPMVTVGKPQVDQRTPVGAQVS